MISTDDALWPLLDRYLAGECTAAEAASVRNWLVVAPQEHEMLFADVQRIRNVIKRRAPVRSPENTWPLVVHELGLISSSNQLSLTNRTTQPRVPTQEQSQTRAWRGRIFKPYTLRRVLWPTFCGAVASAVIVMMMWHSSMQATSERSATAVTTYLTRNGERAEIRLPDGSSVALNVASRLEVPGDYLAGNHTVRLIGEALFTVSHQAGKPFTVLAGPTMTQVLGTSFLVRRYAADTTAVVAVQEGRVATHVAAVAPVVLTSAQQVVIHHAGTGTAQMADPALFSFAMGVLTLNGGVLPDVIPDLDRWYDVDIRLGDPALATHHMTAKLAAGSLADLTGILEGTFDVRVVRDGRVLTLLPR